MKNARNRAGVSYHQMLSALACLDVVALRSAGIQLARAANALLWILDHFFPLGNPADRSCHREQHGEHGGGKAECLQRDA